MKKLFIIDLKDYNENMPRFKRLSVRAIIIKNGLIAMVYSKKYDYYKFPGGGIEKNEDILTALKREVLEETGLKIIDASITELGSVLRIQKSRFNDSEIFEQENYYYLCDIDSEIQNQYLDEYESDEGFRLVFLSPDVAVLVNRSHEHFGYDRTLIERESMVLEYLMENDYI